MEGYYGTLTLTGVLHDASANLNRFPQQRAAEAGR